MILLDKSSINSFNNGSLGTHSLRKGSATYIKRCGVPKDYIKMRGRWRGKKEIIDTYIDLYQPYPDALAASGLTGPSGPARYILNDSLSALSDTYICDNIVPGITNVMGRNIAKILALPLIYAAINQTSTHDNNFA